jgi:ribosomal protein S18 acetylase RimI-like enzyme
MALPEGIVQADTDARLREAGRLFAEYAALLRDRHGQGCLGDLDRELRELPGPYAPPAGRLLLAWEGAAALGCVALRPAGAGAGEVKRLYVGPAGRGRGLGRVLMQALVTEARAVGYARLVLDTLPTMTEALALYRSLGFVPTDPYLPRHADGAICLELLVPSAEA